MLRTITSPVMQRCGVDEAQRGGVDEAHSDLVAGTEIEHSEVQLEYRPVCDQPMDDEMHHVPASAWEQKTQVCRARTVWCNVGGFVEQLLIFVCWLCASVYVCVCVSVHVWVRVFVCVSVHVCVYY